MSAAALRGPARSAWWAGFTALLLCVSLARCQCVVSEYEIRSRQRDSGPTADAGQPDAMANDAAMPDSPAPDVQNDAALPDAARPDTLMPDTSLPDSARPDSARPDTSTPTDSARPDSAAQDTAAPDTATPDAAMPDTSPEDSAGTDGCTADCTDKCGGADDGCGGSCTSCPLGQWCSGQACLDCDSAAHCGPPNGACLDCSVQSNNMECVNRSCGCIDIDDCALGDMCTAGNSCAACNIDTACGGTGETCVDCTAQASHKICLNRACACVLDDDCALGEWCNAGACQDCTLDDHCGAAGVACSDCSVQSTDKVCVNRACGCTDDGDCALGQWCNNGACADCNVAAHCGDVGEACVDCSAQSTNKACVNRACGCTDAGLHCVGAQTCDGATDLCLGNVDQCATGEHDCNPCSEVCADADDGSSPPGWTCGCNADYYDDSAGCSFDTSTPPDVTFTAGSAHNISSDNFIAARTNPDDPNDVVPDAPSYAVTGLTASSAALNSAPGPCRLNRGDEVMLINLQGAPGATDTVGHWELLEVSGVSTATVHFKAAKTRYYGSATDNDSDIGTSAGQQRVMLLRVPTYGAVTVEDDYPNTTLTADAWNGQTGGVLAARMSSFTLNGVINMLGKGYVGGSEACAGTTDRAQQGESIDGLGQVGGSPGNWPLAAVANIGGGGGGCYNSDFDQFPGGGGGYGAAGTTIVCSGGGADACDAGDAEGGEVYGGQDLSYASGKLFLGSGGGGGGDAFVCSGNDGGPGGGAVAFLIAGDLNTALTARIYADGEYSIGADGKGGGSGGSIYIEAANVSVTEPSQPIYARGGNRSGPAPLATGGDGRIHFNCSGTCIDSDDTIPTPYYTP